MLYILVFLALIVLELSYFRLAERFGIIDYPYGGSTDAVPTLRGGGVIFYISVILFFIISGWQYPLFVTALTIVALVSFIDDIRDVAIPVRLIAHFIAVALLFCQFGMVAMTVSPWIIAGAVIVGVGIMNAYNFMDGINGMTGIYSLVVVLSLALANKTIGFVDFELIWFVGISAGVFCLFNLRRHARCFAGDVGSVSMGFIHLFMLLSLIVKTGDVTYLVFLAVYGVDTVMTLAGRLICGENIFRSHRSHAYQRLVDKFGLSHLTVAGLFSCLQLAISLGVLYLPVNKWVYLTVVVLTLITGYICLTYKTRGIRLPDAW